MDFSKMMKEFGRKVSDNAPAILTGMAVTGAVTSAIFAAKGGHDATLILEEARKERYMEADNSGEEFEDFSFKEKFGLVWSSYLPATLMCGTTVACIIGSNQVSTRRNAAIMSAYSLTDAAFKEYKEKVVEQIGKEKEQKVREEIGKDHLEKNPLNKEVVVLGRGDTLCYDALTGRYFNSDMESIRKAMNNINQKCINEVYASQNDFYREIGLDPVALGEEVGWRSDHLLDISFSSHLSGDGTPCLALDYLVGPIRGYYKGY